MLEEGRALCGKCEEDERETLVVETSPHKIEAFETTDLYHLAFLPHKAAFIVCRAFLYCKQRKLTCSHNPQLLLFEASYPGPPSNYTIVGGGWGEFTSCGLAVKWVAVSSLSVCMGWGVYGECNLDFRCRIHSLEGVCFAGQDSCSSHTYQDPSNDIST